MAAAKRVLRYLCSTSGMGLVLGGRSPAVLTGHADASWADDQATQRSSQGYTFSLGFGSVSWRATRSSSVLGSSCEAEIYAGAMAAQELRWLSYLLTDLGESPRSPPVLYVDNKAMLALCREQRLEHRTKHIALRYFLARELQQRGQLRLAYVASEANTADVFTKALAPCDHQRFCTQLVNHSRFSFLMGVLSLRVLRLGVLSPGGAESGGDEPGGAEPGGTTPEGAGPAGAVRGGSPGASSRPEPLSPQELREWFARCWRRAVGAGGTAGTGGSVAAEGAGATGPGGARIGSTGAARPAGTSGIGAATGVGAETTAVGPRGGPTGGTTGVAGGTGAGAATGASAVPAVSGVAARPRPYFVPLLQQVLGLPSSTGPPPPLECPQPVPSQLQLQLASPLPAPSPYTGPTGGLAERREPASRPASPVRAARTSGRGSRQRPPPIPGTHRMSLRPSTAPLRAPLPSPPETPLPALADPESDSLRAANPTLTRLLATVVTDPCFEFTAASALVAELVDFAARCQLDYAASLVTESESVCPPSVGGECALGTDVLEDRQEEFQCLAAASPHLVSVLLTPEGDPDALDIPTPRSYAEAIEGPYSSQWQAAMDAEMASWKSTGTYVDEVPPPGANIVSGMWIFRVKRPPGSPPVFKARYVACGFSQQQGVDYFHTFSPTPKTTTLRVLQRFGFTYSSPQATPLPTRHSLSALPSDESVESSGPYPELVGCLMYMMTCTRPDLAYPLSILACYVAPGRHRPEHMAAAKRVLRYLCSTSGMGLVLGGRSPVVLTRHADASWADDQATQRSSQGYTFSLGSGYFSWRATRSSSVLGSSCEAEIYAGALLGHLPAD
ncbi:unnamed protein product [Closterium sp. NIES-54]